MKLSRIYQFLILIYSTFYGSYSEFQCEKHRVRFEKVLGRTLSTDQYKSTVPMTTRANISYYECHELCRTDPDCTAYSIDHRYQVCHITTNPQIDQFLSTNLESSSELFYFRKRCLRGPSCKKVWAFMIIPGVKMKEKSETERVIRNVLTRDECQEYCFVETRYNCRSAIYFQSTRLCVLNNKSFRTAPEEYSLLSEVNEDDGIYMENTCVKEPKKCKFSKGFVEDKVYTEKIFWEVQREKCAQLCLDEDDFLCTGFVHDEVTGQCDLTSKHIASEVSKIPTLQRPKLVRFRGKCANVVMKCDATTMTAVVTVDSTFKGRIYALSHPYGCFSVPSFSNQDEIFLTMPLWGKQCGTKDLGNGTYSNSIIIQEHPSILRNTDKRVDVYCDYDVVRQKLRSGKEVLEGNDVTEIQSTVTGVVPTPRIQLRIVNETDEEVTGVALGQNLRLRIEILDESVFGIFGRDLVARSGDNEEFIRLIDEQGCPIEPSVFPSLEVEKGRKTLSSDFKAFKFATNQLVKFELTISFCLDKCLPVECSSENDLKSASFGKRRKKRSSINSGFHEDYRNGAVVTDVRMQKTLLVISDMKSTKEAFKQKENLKPASFPNEDNPPSPSSPFEGFCVTKPIMYTFIGCVTLFQILTILACMYCVLCARTMSEDSRSRLSPSSSSTPHDSVSSRRKLFPSPTSRFF